MQQKEPVKVLVKSYFEFAFFKCLSFPHKQQVKLEFYNVVLWSHICLHCIELFFLGYECNLQSFNIAVLWMRIFTVLFDTIIQQWYWFIATPQRMDKSRQTCSLYETIQHVHWVGFFQSYVLILLMGPFLLIPTPSCLAGLANVNVCLVHCWGCVLVSASLFCNVLKAF